RDGQPEALCANTFCRRALRLKGADDGAVALRGHWATLHSTNVQAGGLRPRRRARLGRSTQGIEHRRAAFSDGQIGAAVKRHLELLLSSLTTMAPWPRSTSKLSSMIWLSRETIAQVPVDTSGHVDSLLGYQVSADVLSLMLIPFWSPSEGFF